MVNKTKQLPKKRILRTILAVICTAAILISTFVFLSAPASAETAIIARTQSSVNLRTGAGTNYSLIKEVDSKVYVTIVDKSQTSWYKVKLSDGTTGYCVSSSIEVLTDCKTTDYVNFRSGPGTSYSIYYTFVPNTRLDIINFANDSWAKVRTSDGTTGYLCTDYVTYVTDTTTTTAAAAQSQSFTLSASSMKIAKGRKTTLDAKGGSGNFEWRSSDSAVAEVTSVGVVNGKKAGTATVTVTDTKSKKYMTCKVEVVLTDYRFIFLSETSKKLEQGQSFTLTGRTEPEGGKFTYKSSDSSVATVDQSGNVKAVKAGTATITASDKTGIITRECKVTVTAKGSVSFMRSSVTVQAGSSVSVGISKNPSNLTVKWSSSNVNVADVHNGLISGLREGTAVITVSDESGSCRDKCTVTVTAPGKGSVSVSRSKITVTSGKTYYIKGYNGSKWTTSDSNVATVWDGFIEGKAPGHAAVSYVDSRGNKAICVVTVTDPAPVKFAYSSPNSATLSSKVTLVAITDKKHTGVYFTVKDGSNPTTVEATSKTAEGNTYVWKGTYTPKTAGTIVVRAYSKYNGVASTCEDGKCDLYVSNKSQSNQTALTALRTSDQVIKNIGDMEGFVSDVTYDTLAGGIPTLGHGIVVWEGESFYNHLTRSEAYAWLVDSVNNGVFASRVNEMLISNGVKFNQQQFDALVSFSYNLGTGWTYSSTLKNILLNSSGRDLKNVNKNALIKEMLSIHHAGGQCYYGLLYRRADELEMFLYNDYTVDGRNNKYKFPNPSCISFP